MEANTSNETNNNDCKEPKRQQFSNKQRMDMYAFCVLELEMHSNKVSIKKQQQAIQKVLNEQQKLGLTRSDLNQTQNSTQYVTNQPQQDGQPPTNVDPNSLQHNHHQQQLPNSLVAQQQQQQQQQNENPPTMQQQPPTTNNVHQQSQLLHQQQQIHQHQNEMQIQQNGESSRQDSINGNCSGTEGKTLLELQKEVAITRKCYSDYQKTQVLTSSMLRDVQRRFAKYYPDSAIPSRTTIKHVFEKCVAHGTVENIKTPRKATKIPHGDEIEYLLIHEPQLSLRQMAQKLNVSTGTVSRRCKALGLIPESVTIKHQQLATARRQKQIKQLESQNKSKSGGRSP